jgi:hypothetical protein
MEINAKELFRFLNLADDFEKEAKRCREEDGKKDLNKAKAKAYRDAGQRLRELVGDLDV